MHKDVSSLVLLSLILRSEFGGRLWSSVDWRARQEGQGWVQVVGSQPQCQEREGSQSHRNIWQVGAGG